jgi:predicted  nucleic acid-binding Zn-ribbon protein
VDGHASSLVETSNFFVAVCSKSASAGVDLKNLVYLPACGNLLREKETRIHSLEQRATGLDQRILRQQEEYDAQSRWCLELNRQMQERTEWAMRLDARIQELDARIQALEGELLERTDWAKRLSVELSEKDLRIVSLQAEFEERTAWALHLNEQLERIKQSRLFRLSKRLGLVPKA